MPGKRPGEENLIPFNQRSKEEQRKIQSMGGVASGAARRQTASLKRAAKIYFKENPDAAMAIIGALVENALDGNVRAAEKLVDLIGESVQREELTLKKKALARQEKPDNGMLEALVQALITPETALEPPETPPEPPEAASGEILEGAAKGHQNGEEGDL